MTDKKKFDIEDFKVGKYHSKPQRMKLYSPDGEETEHYFDVIGFNSPQVRKKKQELLREMAKNLKEGEFSEEKQQDLGRKLLAEAIVDWSFNIPCDEENKMEFLYDAPQIADAVDIFCGDNSNYFEKK